MEFCLSNICPGAETGQDNRTSLVFTPIVVFIALNVRESLSLHKLESFWIRNMWVTVIKNTEKSLLSFFWSKLDTQKLVLRLSLSSKHTLCFQRWSHFWAQQKLQATISWAADLVQHLISTKKKAFHASSLFKLLSLPLFYLTYFPPGRLVHRRAWWASTK